MSLTALPRVDVSTTADDRVLLDRHVWVLLIGVFREHAEWNRLVDRHALPNDWNGIALFLRDMGVGVALTRTACEPGERTADSRDWAVPLTQVDAARRAFDLIRRLGWPAASAMAKAHGASLEPDVPVFSLPLQRSG